MTEYAGSFSWTGAPDETQDPAGGPALSALVGWRELSAAKSRVRLPQGNRAWVRTVPLQTALADALMALAVAGAFEFVRLGADSRPHHWTFLLVPVLWVVAVWVSRGYTLAHIGGGSDEYRDVGRATLLVACIIALVSYVGDLHVPRSLMLPLVPCLFVGTLATHFLSRQRLISRRLSGECLRRTVVVGRVDSVASMIREINSAPTTGFTVVGACVSGIEPDSAHPDMVEGVPVVGPPQSALRAVDSLHADVVAVSSHPDLSGQPLRRLGWALAEREVDLIVSPGIVEVAGPRLSLRPAAGLSLLHVERPTNAGARVLVKRTIDLVMALGLVVVASPVLLAFALLVKFTSPGPVFFRQERVGAHGEHFKMIKFRSMVVDAEALLASVGGHEVNAVLFKNREDPRITPVGRFIRRYSIDELPQLFNVLLGDMSLVGPRPPLPSEVAAYEPDAVQRLRVRPGMTGLWQISGRSDLGWEQSLRLDLWYVDNWSPVLDLQILVRTVRAVFSHTGAY